MPICFDQEITKDLAIFVSNCHLPTSLPQEMEVPHCIFFDRQAKELWIPIFIVLLDWDRTGVYTAFL